MLFITIVLMDFYMPVNEMPYDHWNPLVRFYFNGILKKAVKLADLKTGETVLDFGCESQQLKKFIPKGVKYVGFDIVPGNSDLKDYRQARPNVVFALSVLEHLEEKELEYTLNDFKQMGVKKLVVSLPTEHFISKILAWLHGFSEEHEDEHKTNWKSVYKILSSRLKQEKTAGFYTMQKMSVWAL